MSRLAMGFRTISQVPGRLQIVWQTSDYALVKLSLYSQSGLNTPGYFNCPQRRKSKGLSQRIVGQHLETKCQRAYTDLKFFSLFWCGRNSFLNSVQAFQIHPRFGYFKTKRRVMDQLNVLVNKTKRNCRLLKNTNALYS